MYIAIHNVRIGKTMYNPGETIDEVLPEAKSSWLIKAGAIKPIAPVSFEGSFIPEADDPAEDVQTEVIQQPEEPVYEDAPEIDVMSGIVHEEEKPKKHRGRKSSK